MGTEQDDYILKILDVGHMNKAETSVEPESSRNSVLVTLFSRSADISILSFNLL